MGITENLVKIKNSLPKNVSLIAVSKTKPNAAILEAYKAGQKDFGENRVQDMVEKYEELPKDIKWHMIGHLQRNKVKYMAHFVHLIHGVDDFKTLVEIDKQAKKHNRIIPCLLQAKIAKEDSKFGLSFCEILEILSSEELKKMQNVSVAGLMGMATFTENKEQIASEFLSLKKFFIRVRKQHNNLTILSMGMSGDYKIAIKNGSNMVRIGSSIFGARNYIA